MLRPAVVAAQRRIVPTYQYACTDCGERTRGRAEVHRRSAGGVPGLRGQAAQGLLPGGHRVQGVRLLPHRQPEAGSATDGTAEGQGERPGPSRTVRRRPGRLRGSGSSKLRLRSSVWLSRIKSARGRPALARRASAPAGVRLSAKGSKSPASAASPGRPATCPRVSRDVPSSGVDSAGPAVAGLRRASASSAGPGSMSSLTPPTRSSVDDPVRRAERPAGDRRGGGAPGGLRAPARP